MLGRSQKISFIMPCYNAEKTITSSIDSIIGLKLDNYEVCAIDDCSSDGTYKILQGYKARLPEVFKIFSNKENVGGGATRNLCVQKTSGDYIFCLDSDNIIHKASFIKLIDAVDGKHIYFFGEIKSFIEFCHIKLVYKTTTFLKDSFDINDLRKEPNNPLTDGNMLFSRDAFNAVKGYSEPYKALDTFTFGEKLLMSGYKVSLVKGTHYFHRVHPGSYWFKDAQSNLEIMKDYLLESQLLSSEEKVKLSALPSSEIGLFFYNKPNDVAITKTNLVFKAALNLYYKYLY